MKVKYSVLGELLQLEELPGPLLLDNMQDEVHSTTHTYTCTIIYYNILILILILILMHNEVHNSDLYFVQNHRILSKWHQNSKPFVIMKLKLSSDHKEDFFESGFKKS